MHMMWWEEQSMEKEAAVLSLSFSELYTAAWAETVTVSYVKKKMYSQPLIIAK